jgi:hypothetical protein
LDGEQVMAMFRRPRKSSPPLRRKQQDIERQEAELRDKLDNLERMVTKGRSTPQNRSRARAEQGDKAEKQFQVSLAMDGGQSLEAGRPAPRRRSMRKERREGRIIFLLLLVALAAAVMWLISHLHS